MEEISISTELLPESLPAFLALFNNEAGKING